MSQFRRDPISDHWVIVAEQRSQRPHEYARTDVRRITDRCPFCAGSEHETPPATAVYTDDAGADSPTGDVSGRWLVRVVPNKYPAVAPLGTAPDPSGAGGLFESRSAVGVHEVIVESPRHLVSFSQLDDRQAQRIFGAYRDRLRHLEGDERITHAQVFKNARCAGGATLEHVHSQLIATPEVPPSVQYEMTKAYEHRRIRGRGLLEEIVDGELDARSRVVEATDRFVVFCPFASRLPYETWIVPRRPAACFQEEEDGALDEAALLARGVVSRFERELDSPGYNYWLRNAPFRQSPGEVHWRLELAPRLSRMAGYELGSGCFINSVDPEFAASRLREGETNLREAPATQADSARKTR